MYAVAREGMLPSVTAALDAGADLVLLAHLADQLTLTDMIADRVRPEAAARIDAARRRVPRTLPPLDVVGCAEHRQIAQEIADASITLVRDDGLLPLRPAPEATIAVITPEPVDLTPADTSSAVTIRLTDALRRRHPRVLDYQLRHKADDAEISALLDNCRDADYIVVGTINAEVDSPQAQLVNALLARGQQPIVAALRTPYDVLAFSEVPVYLCAYGIRDSSTEAVAKVLFGEIVPGGVLPCAMPGAAPSDMEVL
jgi:beta-N-acetylhexosaminidase